MDTKKLRQKILDLAIHGKLVPQDPNDEPASVLLERIRAEKEQLIKEGKIKAPKKSKTAGDTSHYRNDGPWELPEGWVWTTLGDIFNLQAGKFIQASDIHEKSLQHPYPCYGGNGIRGFVSSYNREGSYPIIGRQGALCGNINFAFGKFYATEHAVVVETCGGINIDWARYLLEGLNLNQYATATAQPGLSVKTINEVSIPIPPEKEQSRIAVCLQASLESVKRLEELTSSLRFIVAEAKTKILDLAIHGQLVPQDSADEPAIDLLKRINPAFKPSYNLHYTDILPDNWCIVPLSALCTTINGLWKGEKEPLVNVGVIRNANFTKDFGLDYSKIEYINVEQRSFEKRNLEDGDIIVEKSGGSDNNPVGRSILFNGESGKYSFSNFTMSLRIMDKSMILPKYLYYVLQCKYRRGEMKQMQTQTTGLHNLLTEKFLSSLIPIPPVREQKMIVLAIEDLFRTVDGICDLVKDRH